MKKIKNKCEEVRNSEIYALKQKGWSYREIQNYYKEQGIKISRSAIQQRCSRVYKKFEEEMPKTTKTAINKEIRKINPEEVYELRERRYTYKQMREYFKEKGIDVSASSIAQICKLIYKKKGLGRPKNGLADSARKYNEDEIIALRKKRMSYQKIADFVTKKYGQSISYITVRRICKKVFSENGDKEKRALREYPTNISDEEIISLRRQGLSFVQMKDYFESTGRAIGRNRLFVRGRHIFGKNEKGYITSVDIRTANKDIVRNALQNLKITKGATDEQLKEIASCYGFEYNSEIKKINPYEVLGFTEYER